MPEFVTDAGADPALDATVPNAALAALLRARITEAGGVIGFAQFMQLALYAPEHGYYMRHRSPFGRGGDFVTAPEISPLFGRVLARGLIPTLESLPKPAVVEIGAGSGALAAAMLGYFADVGFAVDYRVLEISPARRAAQRRRLSGIDIAAGTTVDWVDELDGGSVTGAIVANEVADALAVDRFVVTETGVDELGVACDGTRFVDVRRPAGESLRRAVADIEAALGRPLPVGYRSELCPGLGAWVGQLAQALSAGVVLVSDYGLSRGEYYSSDRQGGTLMSHSRHRADPDVLADPGSRDITAWVDFTALAEAGTAAGLELAGYTTQSGFLIAAGLADELAGHGDLPIERALARAGQAKTLTLPGEMGERFRFMALGRGMIAPPRGFSGTDLCHSL